MRKLCVQDNSIAIVGWHDGAAGQISTWIEKAHGYNVACFINPTDSPLNIDPSRIHREASQFSYPTADSFKGKPLINTTQWTAFLKEMGISKVLVTTDINHERYDQIREARQAGLKLINAIHPTVVIMDEVIMQDNIILYPNTFIGYRTELSAGVIVTSAHLDFKNIIKECVNIDPGVVTAANIVVGKCTRIHSGAIIKNNMKIGSDSVLGAGTVIIEDVPDHVTVVGVPGKIIKVHKPETSIMQVTS